MKINLYIMIYLLIIIAGFGGGAVRGLVGFIKHQFAYKNVPFQITYFLTMMFVSGAIGLLSAMAVRGLGIKFLSLESFTPALAFVVGYAGGDFLENIYKIIIKRSSLYSADSGGGADSDK